MKTFEVKTKHSMFVAGEYYDRTLSIKIRTMVSNPFDEKEKIHQRFMKVHGLDLKTEGYLNNGHLEYYKL